VLGYFVNESRKLLNENFDDYRAQRCLLHGVDPDVPLI
jgi:hypothetical protein